MDRLQFVLVPLLVAVGVASFAAYQDALDVEMVVSIVVFLVLAVPIGILAERLTQRLRER